MNKNQFAAEAHSIMNAANGMFTQIFGPIKDSAVDMEIIAVTGGRTVTRWSGVDKDPVVKRAARHVEELGRAHCPSASEPYHHEDGFAVDVTSYTVQV